MRTLILSIFFFSCINLFAQEEIEPDQQWFSISSNIVSDVINDFNINIEHCFNPHISVGATVGRIYYHDQFSVVFLSPSQNYWPGTVYHGNSLRLYLKYYPNERAACYWSLQGIYKAESFSGIKFIDEQSGDDESEIDYTRNEKASVWGLDFINGYELWRGQQPFFIDIFYGLGFRNRNRSGTTVIDYENFWDNGPDAGPYHINQTYPTIVFGVKIGFYVWWKYPPPSVPF